MSAEETRPAPLSARGRLLLGFGAPALLALGLRWLRRGGHLLCVFYELTGLYCPGCGSGRAARALLRGDLAAAFGHNALAFLLGLPCAGLLLWEYLRLVFPGLELKRVRLPGRAATAALVLILTFWLLRNLPAFAFLAPSS